MTNYKSFSNNASKVELFSKKQVLNALKCAFDADANEENTRKYVYNIGFSAEEFKAITWQDLDAYIIVKNTKGYCSTWAMHNALRKYADANNLLQKRAKEAAEREEAIKLAEAQERMKEEQRRKARNEARKAKRAAKKAA